MSCVPQHQVWTHAVHDYPSTFFGKIFPSFSTARNNKGVPHDPYGMETELEPNQDIVGVSTNHDVVNM